MPPTPSTVTSVTELAQSFLDTCSDALEQTTAGPPALQFLDAGPAPAWDCCPALFAFVTFLTEEPTAPQQTAADPGRRAQYQAINLVTTNVVVLRCAANPDHNGNVLASEKSAVAATVQEDGWAMWCGLNRAIRLGTFKDLCTIVHRDFGAALIEGGGCVGWQFTIRAQLGGFTWEEAS